MGGGLKCTLCYLAGGGQLAQLMPSKGMGQTASTGPNTASAQLPASGDVPSIAAPAVAAAAVQGAAAAQSALAQDMAIAAATTGAVMQVAEAVKRKKVPRYCFGITRLSCTGLSKCACASGARSRSRLLCPGPPGRCSSCWTTTPGMRQQQTGAPASGSPQPPADPRAVVTPALLMQDLAVASIQAVLLPVTLSWCWSSCQSCVTCRAHTPNCPLLPARMWARARPAPPSQQALQTQHRRLWHHMLLTLKARPFFRLF